MKAAQNGTLSLFEQKLTAEELAADLIDELRRSGRLRGNHSVLVIPKGSAGATVGVILRTDRNGETIELRPAARAAA